MKKLAVVVCGWHYSSHFYETMIKQKIPKGYEIEYFIVSHRDPIYSHGEKNVNKNTDGMLTYLDYILYEKDITKDYLENLGWNYFKSNKKKKLR